MDSIRPCSSTVTIPSAMFCSTARARTSLSRSDALRAVIESSECWCSWALADRSTNAVTLARSASSAIGAKMKSTAPLAYAPAVSISSRPNAVMKMIGVTAASPRSRISFAVS